MTLRFDCHIEGIGVDPTDPPLAWEAWTGDDWRRCEVERDTTGGFNRDGDVVIHVPSGHEASVIDSSRAGWLRARVVADPRGPAGVRRRPGSRRCQGSRRRDGRRRERRDRDRRGDRRLRRGAGPALPAPAGTGRPRPGGRRRGRVRRWLAGVAGGDHFAESGADDQHFTLDVTAGEVIFGPAVRLADGTLRPYGEVPPKGATLRVREYRVGGGRRATSPRCDHRAALVDPVRDRVENRPPAVGGVDGEDIENAKVRGPIVLRTRDRAVTAEDYEQLAREAAPEVARVRALAVDDDDDGRAACGCSWSRPWPTAATDGSGSTSSCPTTIRSRRSRRTSRSAA